MSIGGIMRIAIDKNSISVIKSDNNEYLYLYDDENYKDLLKLGVHCIYYKKCEYVDINLTDYNVDCFKKAKINDKDWNRIPDKINHKIGIIIPNYNYSECLKKCINSVFNQTYKNFEIVFIDDVSTDDSVHIAKTLLKPPHKVIELKQKRYNGGARNEALLHFSEDVNYILCLDSDDWLIDNNALEKINNKLQKNPDVLFAGLSQFKNNQLKTLFIPKYENKLQALKGWSGCGKVIKKSLAIKQECLYNEGTLKEDKNHHCKICINMNSYECLKEPIYVWNKENTKSVTTDRKNIMWKTSTIRHYADTMQLYLTYKGKDIKIDRYLEERLRLTKAEIERGGDSQW